MKLTTFIPPDTGNLRISSISDVINYETPADIEIGHTQPGKENFSELFSKLSNSSLKKTVQNTDRPDHESTHLLVDDLSNPIKEFNSFSEEKQTVIETMMEGFEVKDLPYFQLELNFQNLKADLNLKNIELNQVYEETNSVNSKSISENEKVIPYVNPVTPFENKNIINSISASNPITEVLSAQHNSSEQLQRNPLNTMARPKINALVDVVTSTASKVTGEVQATLTGQTEKTTMAFQENIRTLDHLSTTRQTGKVDTVAMTTPPVIKSSTPVVTAILNEKVAQIPVLPSIILHEASSVIAQSVTDSVTQNIRASDAVSVDITNTRSTKSIELQLVPRSLGVVEIKIVHNNGQLNIMMRTQTLEAENLLRLETSSLQEVIRSAGIMVDDVKVTIQHQSDLYQIRQAKYDESLLMQSGQNDENQTSPDHHEHKESMMDSDAESQAHANLDKKIKEPESRDGLYL